jgi:DNA polymerase I-like protein with 3'-5' exonuclease and polymerase domains
LYSAGDVTYLEQIMWSQVKDYKAKGGTIGAKLECDFVPAIAYLEWCGIKLDVDKWREKMKKDQENLDRSIKALNDFVINTPILKEFVYIERQGDLFSGFDTSPRVNINWASSSQATKVFKLLGFDVNVVDKDSGEDKESAMEKHMKKQKGINDAFLRLYFGKGEEGEEDYFPGYNGSAKVVSSFGQGHIDAINPKTGRIHTSYKQIGASSGRMSCGSKQPNTDLAKYKKLPEKSCKYPNIQQLPKDVETRSCFISEENNLFCSCDYSALESRLGADIYNEQSMIEEFLHGSGDMHSLCAYMVYKDEIPRDTPIKSIKKLYPHLRSAVKPIEFSQQFGGSEYAIQNSMGCSLEEALAFKKAYDSGFPGIAKFKEAGAKFVCSNGYILMNKYTGHKMYWWDWEYWKQKQAEFNTPGFWDTYKLYHKGQKTNLEKAVKKHFKIKSKYERMALNSPTQGTGITILKDAMTTLFNWVVDNGYFGKVLFCAFVHDECDIEFPKELTDFPKIVSDIMLNSAAKFCKSIPIPADAEVSTHWIH